MTVALVERHLSADFRYKGNRAKRKLRLSPRPSEGRSLDSFKQLATSEKPQTCAELLKARTNALDRHRKAWFLYTALLETLKPLMHKEGLRYRCDVASSLRGVLPDSEVPANPRRKRREWSATKDYERLSSCQSEWIGFKANCCESRVIAVPIGCNHRLCPLCNNHRAERYRKRVQTLFGELRNPQLLTLTVPSPKRMSREVLDTLRTRLKAFLKQQKAFLLGGVYSIEITYTPGVGWHPHVHVLCDVNDTRKKLPWREFVERKWRLEFEWFVLTQGKARAGVRRWKSADFVDWCGGRSSSGRLHGPSDGRHRRVVDLRPITSDRKAAYEVLKYMSKAATFINEPEALKELLIAIRGVRQIQTFGTCYNFSFGDDAPAESHLECDCGANVFERIGTLGMGMVKLSPEGTWYVRDDAPVHGRRCREGTHRERRKQWHT